jgi:hypothetical protein
MAGPLRFIPPKTFLVPAAIYEVEPLGKAAGDRTGRL